MGKKECTCGYEIGHPLVPVCTCKPKKWFGITKSDVESWKLPVNVTVYEFVKFVEKKIKRKNHG